MIRTFHEGIASIMEHYGLKHIQIQGLGIFGIVSSQLKNDENDQRIFDCAKEIKGYLFYVWKMGDYKISVATESESILVPSHERTRESMFAGSAIQEAKKLINETNVQNVILFNNCFVHNNNQVLFNKTQNKTYISGRDNGVAYSAWKFTDWSNVKYTKQII